MTTNLRVSALEATLRVSESLQRLCRKRSWTSQYGYNFWTVANVDAISISI